MVIDYNRRCQVTLESNGWMRPLGAIESLLNLERINLPWNWLGSSWATGCLKCFIVYPGPLKSKTIRLFDMIQWIRFTQSLHHKWIRFTINSHQHPIAYHAIHDHLTVNRLQPSSGSLDRLMTSNWFPFLLWSLHIKICRIRKLFHKTIHLNAI